jgi:hypothetical protein
MRASAPAIRRSAFQRSFAPALAARFASTDAAASAKDGKIYQVIGAVVDGTKSFSERWQWSCPFEPRRTAI